MKQVVDFLKLLHANNDKAWFDAHKETYKQALSCFEEFTSKLIEGIASFDRSVEGLTVRDCTYRIYRDVRFSPNKEPYKTYMGAYIAPHGKKSGFAGYYFHAAPYIEGESEGSLLTSGLYMPEPQVLKSVRDEIFDNGAEIVAAIAEAKGFSLDRSNRLKRTPKGYPAGSEFDDMLRLKDIYLVKPVDEDLLSDKQLLEKSVEEFRKTRCFVDILNRAVKFAHEEMM